MPANKMKNTETNSPLNRLRLSLQPYFFERLNARQLNYDKISHALNYFSQPDFQERYLARSKGVNSRVIGQSFNGENVHQFTLGHGPIIIVAWSQMHGDESTATASLFDLMNLLMQSNLPKQRSTTKAFDELPLVASDWEKRITLHLVPMLNPDGAKMATRRNAQDIDINRDALSLQTPEGKILNKFIEETKPDFAFNLHDQDPYYGCRPSVDIVKPVTMAFLAPPFNQEGDIDLARFRAMALISTWLEELIPMLDGQVARYDDTYAKHCFGDQIAGKKISTILIESGHYPGDDNRQIARLGTLYCLLHSINTLCDKKHEMISEHLPTTETTIKMHPLIQPYEHLPDNVENLWPQTKT